MYLVYLTLAGETVTIHNYKPNRALPKLPECRVVLGESGEIESCTFAIYPDNPGYDRIYPRRTALRVYSVTQKADVFRGRVLSLMPAMDEDGTLYKEVVCESEKGYLQDSVQPYLAKQTWTAADYIAHLLEEHNSQVDAARQIFPGSVTVEGELTAGTAYETTWSCLTALLKALGGEIDLRRDSAGLLRLDYAPQLGETRSTKLALGTNLERITKTEDSASLVTRLIPLGARLEGSDERLTIADVNGGSIYLDNATAQSAYGVVAGTKIFDEVTDPAELLTLGTNALQELCKPSESYQVQALNLHDIGLASDAVERFCSYPVEAEPLEISTTLRCIRVELDVVDPTATTVDLGDKAVTQSQLVSQIAASVATRPTSTDVETTLKAAILAATNAITGNSGGYVVLRPKDAPEEILVLDQPNVDDARNVWRWNLAGLGHSADGVDGPYTLAILADGSINADMITAGVLQGIKIIGTEGTIGGLTMTDKTLSATYRYDYQEFTEDDVAELRHMIVEETEWTPEQIQMYDLNLDGEIDIGDLASMNTMVNNGGPWYSVYKISIDTTNPSAGIKLEVTDGWRAGWSTVIGMGIVRTRDMIADNSMTVNGAAYFNGSVYMQNGTPLSDFVTEQGTDGIWTYRKWHSGRAECWGSATLNPTTDGTTSAGTSYSTINYVDLPFAMKNMVITGTAQNLCTISNPNSSGSQAAFRLMRPGTMVEEVAVKLYVCGDLA